MPGAFSPTQPLFLITDGTAAKDRSRIITTIRCAFEGAGQSIAAVILREQVAPTPLSDDALCSLYEELLPLCCNYDVSLIIHRSIELAQQLACAGIHLQKEISRIILARAVLGDAALIGYSAHSDKELNEAFRCGANYCFFSPVFSPQSKLDSRRSIGLEYLREVCKSCCGAVIALGGITPENAFMCRKAGASGIAMISSIFNTPNPKNAAADLAAAWFNTPET